MKVSTIREEKAERLQKILLLVRRSAGWTAATFGEKIGVTRQTVNNLESNRNALTKTQYLAIRYVLDNEIKNDPKGTEMLQLLLEEFVDNPDQYKSKEKKELLANANMLAPSILAGSSSREATSKALLQMITSLGLIAGAVALGIWSETPDGK